MKKKVTDQADGIYTNSVYSNNTNDNLTEEDDNGNRASVADLCKKFDDKPIVTMRNGHSNLYSRNTEVKLKVPQTDVTSKLTNGKAKVNGFRKSPSSSVVTAVKKSDVSTAKCQSNADVLQSNSKLDVREDSPVKNGTAVEKEEVIENENISNGEAVKSSSRVNNFASYISTKDYQKGDDKSEENSKETCKNDMDTKENNLGTVMKQNVSRC